MLNMVYEYIISQIIMAVFLEQNLIIYLILLGTKAATCCLICDRRRYMAHNTLIMVKSKM